MTTAASERQRAGALNKKFLIGGFIILVAIAALTFVNLTSDSLQYYKTLGEARVALRPGDGQIVRINGVADISSVRYDAQKLDLSFDIVEGSTRLPVSFHGVIPDTFNQSESVVVEGSLNKSGVFEARTLLVKCPSRYEPVVSPST